KRELHIQQSLDVLNLGDPENSVPATVKTLQLESTCLTSNSFFTVYKWKLNGLVDFKQSAPYLLCSVLSGNGTMTIDSRIYCLKKGDHFILPNDVTDWEIDGQLEMIVSHPNEA
ncbi:MAG: mannose-6-phosphate isomerase, partial [Streptococcus sp.]|nr:mannose-6-phosphate isomerase [Streptococcus sp.]